MSYGKNIRRFRQLKGMSQKELADYLGYKSLSTIGKWENEDNEPPMRVIKKLSELFEVPMQKLVGDYNRSESCSIPILGRVIAGEPIEAIEDVMGYEEIPDKLAMSGTFFALKIKGNSMNPRFIEDDIVIVRKQPDVETNDIAIVLINGNEATCKKVRKTKEGIMLIPLNLAYEPMFYSNEEIESLPVRIIGKVVELRGRF